MDKRVFTVVCCIIRLMKDKLGIFKTIALSTGTLAVIAFAALIILYARGYRFDNEEGLSAHGLLVVKSDPNGAQVFINGDLETATDDNLSLLPDSYDVEISKEGYLSWKKRLTIREGEVTEVKANLFKSAPSLAAITFTGGVNPVPSRDGTKIAYAVPVNTESDTNGEKSGLWILETINLPIGFSREPRQIASGNLTEANWIWSPDGREILLETETGSFLLDTGEFTPQIQRINIGEIARQETLAEWQEELDTKTSETTRKLPEEFEDILERKVSQLAFSPDKDMLLYIASGSAVLEPNLVDPIPGASTQKQDRDIKPGHTYVYDIEEDRNFLIDNASADLIIEGGYTISDALRRLSWFPSSRNLVLAEEGRVIIMDLDGTNRQTVYSGSFVAPHAFPTVSDDRLILLTNFGATDTIPNLYSVSLK